MVDRVKKLVVPQIANLRSATWSSKMEAPDADDDSAAGAAFAVSVRIAPKEKRRGVAHAAVAAAEVEIEQPEEAYPVVEWRAGMKTRELLCELYGLGFVRVSQSGSHIKLVRGLRTVIVPDHPEQQRGILGSIAGQAGVVRKS